MLNRRQWFQIAGVSAVAGVGGAAWMAYGPGRSASGAGGPFRHYPFDPVAVMQMTSNAEVGRVATEVRTRLERVRSALVGRRAGADQA